jgi:hypothetical protein
MTDQPHWHLHVTVKPHWTWTLRDVTEALRRDIERYDIKPVVITNHFRDPARKPYRELIPTKHFQGSETEAHREIFHMGVLLNNAGWRVKRLKIEGDPRVVTPGRAIYYECHLRNVQWIDHLLPKSTTARSTFHTGRRQSTIALRELVLPLLPRELHDDIHYEACVYDTAPELDADWIGGA